MSETKHTQSKWSIERDIFGRIDIVAPASNGLTYVIAQDIGGEVRKDAKGQWTDRSEVEANARLLLAAPGLLAAGGEALALLEGMGAGVNDKGYADLTAAIAAATGATP